MTRAKLLALACAGSAALLATTTLAQPVSDGGKRLNATLSGANEVPPADPDGSGTAKITVNAGQGRICWEITTRNIDAVTMAHIHSGLPGQNGSIVVHLSAVADDTATGCTTVVGPGSGGGAIPRSLLDAIRKSPQAFYVNVHTGLFPAGAIRGQLG